jgi:hypothetical protein
MIEAEWVRRYNEALATDLVVERIWDVLCDIAPADQKEIVRMLFSKGKECDLTFAALSLCRFSVERVEKIMADEINLGD